MASNHDEQMNQRREKREAMRRKHQAEQRRLKIALIVSLIIFIAFNVVIGNIVGVVADSVVIVTTLADLWRTREKKDKTA